MAEGRTGCDLGIDITFIAVAAGGGALGIGAEAGGGGVMPGGDGPAPGAVTRDGGVTAGGGALATGAETGGGVTAGGSVTGSGRTIDSDRIAIGFGAAGAVVGGLLAGALRSSKRRWTPRLRASMSINRRRMRDRPDCPAAPAIGSTSLTSQLPAITVD